MFCIALFLHNFLMEKTSLVCQFCITVTAVPVVTAKFSRNLICNDIGWDCTRIDCTRKNDVLLLRKNYTSSGSEHPRSSLRAPSVAIFLRLRLRYLTQVKNRRSFWAPGGGMGPTTSTSAPPGQRSVSR